MRCFKRQTVNILIRIGIKRYEDYDTSPAMISEEQLTGLIENDHFYKIVEDGSWVGAINVKKLEMPGNYKLHMVYVLPEFQNRQIGQVAIQQVEHLFPDATIWYLESVLGN